MNLQNVIDQLQLTVLTERRNFTAITPEGGYSSDLLSCVMAGAKKDNLWITLQAHMNIVAVAAMLEVAAVIITENAMPEPATISRANEKGITLFLTDLQTYEVAGRLWAMGLKTS